MDLEDRLALGLRREVEEEDLIEAASPQKLRRQQGDVVRRGDDEDRCGLVLHPSEDGAEDALGRAAVKAAAREALLQLVDPQHAWRDRLRELEHPPYALLALAHQ